MKKIISAALLTLAVGGVNAQAYLGATVGVTTANLACPANAMCDKTDTGFKIYGGYTVVEGLAAELGYLDYGQNAGKLGVATFDVKSHAIYLAAAMHGDFTTAFGGTLRLGAAKVKTSGTYGFGAAQSVSEDKFKAYVGLGLDYAFTKNWKGVAAADFTTAEVKKEEVAVRMFSLGAQYNF